MCYNTYRFINTVLGGENMAKAKAQPPPYVLQAILEGDAVRHLAFSSAGGQAKARNARIRKAVSARQESSFSTVFDAAIEAEQRQILLRDARAHAMRNLAGISQD